MEYEIELTVRRYDAAAEEVRTFHTKRSVKDAYRTADMIETLAQSAEDATGEDQERFQADCEHDFDKELYILHGYTECDHCGLGISPEDYEG